MLNLASDNMTAAVNGLARTTGTEEVPPSKIQRGYRYVKDKFGIANLTPDPSELVQVPRIKECPVQMEAELVETRETLGGFVSVIEVKILRAYVSDDLRLKGYENRVDPDAWHPMIMSFQHLYGLRNGKIAHSTLAEVDEDLYRKLSDAKRVPASGPASAIS